tara:strand:+ start:210 stop:809 length:600 start_codon:yes stop_codon:yes gene_type:complete
MESRRYNFIPKTNDSLNWFYFDKAFSKEELDKIKRDVALLEYTRAATFDPDLNARKSNIKWIPQNETWDWLYHKLMDLASAANDEMWQFDLQSAPEQIQYTEYNDSELGKYDWHQDNGPNEGSHRKISITVQLSEDTEYVGGDLCFWNGGGSLEENIDYAPRGSGNVVIFPSYLVHSVKPVTKGMRKSFVLWLGGSTFK